MKIMEDRDDFGDQDLSKMFLLLVVGVYSMARQEILQCIQTPKCLLQNKQKTWRATSAEMAIWGEEGRVETC